MTADPHVAARDLANCAGDALLEVRARLVREGVEPAELKRAGDASAQRVLAAALAADFSGDAVLSEEARDTPARLSASRVWIIDPLDGTREFSEPSRDDWAVHVALWEEGDLVAGAVALPARGCTHSTATVTPLPERGEGPLRLAVSRSRPPALIGQLTERLDVVLVPLGSAGVKTMSVVDGSTDAYIHAGGQYEWDSAAPVAVARAHGLHTSRIDGNELSYNSPSPWLPDLIVCRTEHAAALLAAIASCDEEPRPGSRLD